MSYAQLILGGLIILLVIFLLITLKPKPKQTVYIICIDLWNCDGAYIKNDIGARFKSYEDAEKWAKKHISGGYYIMIKN